LWESNGSSAYAVPFRVIPDSGQVSEYSAKPLPRLLAWATKQCCDVLQDCETGS
jgi:hypothetical protein